MLSVVGAGVTTALPAGSIIIPAILPTMGLVSERLAHVPANIQKVPRLLSTGERREQRSTTQRKKSLWCRSGYSLQVFPNGTVSATQEHNNKYSILEFVTVTMLTSVVSSILNIKNTAIKSNYLITIQGVESKRYVCMNRKGHVYGSKQIIADECQFREDFRDNTHNTYSLSINRPGRSKKRWYLYINEEGKILKGPRGNVREAQFLPRKIVLTTTGPPFVFTPPTPTQPVPSWENCTKKIKRRCCRKLSKNEKKKCRRRYNIKSTKKGKKKKSRRKKGKSKKGRKLRKRRKHHKKSTTITTTMSTITTT